MPTNEQPKAEDLKHGLDQLGTEVTAADLVRAKGQSRKVRVISEQQLMDWILKLLQTQLAGKADAFSDAEKEALLKKAQGEIARRMQREKELAAEQDKAKQTIADLMGRMSAEHASQGDRDNMLAELKRQLEEREQLIQDLENDKDDLQDQLSEKLALLSTTITEKDKLKTTVRNQMIRSGALVEGVLGLDTTYYGGRHQADAPVGDDANEEEQFYHDFDVGAQIITTLSSDLERLHNITQQVPGADAISSTPASSEDAGLMQRNLTLLEQLKAGNLHAMDVAEPVETLIEAMGGARDEAEAFRSAMSGALGAAQAGQVAISELPDASGDPAEVLAGATTIARELAAELARGRARIQALKQMADEADTARQTAEADLDAATTASHRLLESIAARAEADGVDTPHAVGDAASPMPERCSAAAAVVARLRGRDQAVAQQIGADLAQRNDQLIKAEERVRALEHELDEAHDQLDAAKVRADHVIAAQRAIAEAVAPGSDAAQSDPQTLAADAAHLAESVRALADEKAELAKRVTELEQAELTMRGRVAKAEEQLAEASTERDEMALSGKEIITQLTQSRDAAVQKLESIKQEHDAARSQVVTLESRAAAAEAANRTLSEALTQLAAAEQDGGTGPVAEGRVDLEMALEQLPEEGETDVVVPADISAQLAAGGAKLAAALVARRQQATATVQQANQEQVTLRQDLDRVRQELAEAKATADRRESDIRSAEAEVAAVRKELESQGRDLAAKTQDLGASRSELASLKAELTVLRKRTEEQESRVRESTEAFHAGSREKETLARRVQELEAHERELTAKIADAEERTSRLAAEQDEMALNSKEVIAQLTAMRDQRTAELEALRREHDQAQLRIAELTTIATAASASSRALADAIAEMAAAEPEATGAIAESRAAMAEAIAELPDEDDDNVVVAPDLGNRLADGARRLAVALATQRREAGSTAAQAARDLAKARQELDTLRAAADHLRKQTNQDQDALAAAQGELEAIRQEFANQGRDLAAKVQELTASRGDAVSLKAELGVVQERVTDQERRLAQATQQLAEARTALGELRARHDEARSRAAALEESLAGLTEAMRSVAGRQDGASGMYRTLTTADEGDQLAKAAQRLEMTQASAPDQVAAAGQGFVRALKDRLQELLKELDQHRTQVATARDAESRMADELAGARAQLVDRDGAIATLKDAVERSRQEHTILLDRVMAAQKAQDETSATLASTQEALRQAQAELDDKLARGETSHGLVSEDNQRLQKDLDAVRARAEELETRTAELTEQVGATEARLKSQRDELSKRLAERDAVIQQKDKIIDQQVAQRADVKALETQAATLRRELVAASDRIQELEAAAGLRAGEAVKSDDLGRELGTLQEERDRLRDQIRRTEADLAEERSVRAQIEAQLVEKRKDVDASRSRLAKEMAEVREKSQALIDENRRMKEEVAGLNARIRRLLDGGKASPTGAHPVLPPRK